MQISKDLRSTASHSTMFTESPGALQGAVGCLPQGSRTVIKDAARKNRSGAEDWADPSEEVEDEQHHIISQQG